MGSQRSHHNKNESINDAVADFLYVCTGQSVLVKCFHTQKVFKSCITYDLHHPQIFSGHQPHLHIFGFLHTAISGLKDDVPFRKPSDISSPYFILKSRFICGKTMVKTSDQYFNYFIVSSYRPNKDCFTHTVINA